MRLSMMREVQAQPEFFTTLEGQLPQQLKAGCFVLRRTVYSLTLIPIVFPETA
jgi:hypothetical protein